MSNDTLEANVIKALSVFLATSIVLFVLAGFFSFFSAWVLMLGLGNVGVNVSYIGALPLAFLLSWKGFTFTTNNKK